MSEFKAGDEVKRKDGKVFTNGNLVCTVGSDGIVSTDISVWIKETNEIGACVKC